MTLRVDISVGACAYLSMQQPPVCYPDLSAPHTAQVLGKSLEYEGAKLKFQPKLEYVQRKFEDRKAKAELKAGAAQNAEARPAGSSLLG